MYLLRHVVKVCTRVLGDLPCQNLYLNQPINFLCYPRQTFLHSDFLYWHKLGNTLLEGRFESFPNFFYTFIFEIVRNIILLFLHKDFKTFPVCFFYTEGLVLKAVYLPWVLLRKTFSRFYRRHYELVPKFNVGLKTLLHQGLSEPEFYGDLIYKLKNIVGRANNSDQFKNVLDIT